ncbi:MAG: hypothetical protein QOK24_1232 [Verrucomicrobiota bacterium]
MTPTQKPRIFIASSVEGLSVANAIQYNLRDDAEVSVWNQGVFRLSATAVDSLEQTTPDFAVFVFSPDDVLKIRGTETPSVRDNLIFELGLFIGRLGRNRCFVLVPERAELHIPTDLIGLTPARYEVGRSDENDVAASASACHEVRSAVRKLGFLSQQSQRPEGSPDSEKLEEASPAAALTVSDTKESHEENWTVAFASKDYDKAERLVQAKLEKTKDPKVRAENEGFLGVIKFERNANEGTRYFEQRLTESPTMADLYMWFAYSYNWAGLYEQALTVFERGIQSADEKADLIAGKAFVLKKLSRASESTETYEAGITRFPQSEGLYLDLAQHYLDTGAAQKARNCLVRGIQALPRSEGLLSKYAILLYDNRNYPGTISVYHRLVAQSPDNATYHTLLGNAYLMLELHNLAYECYLKADQLAESREGWIVANIGNVLSNRGFTSAAITKFKDSLRLDPDAQYSHERLARAMTLKAAEDGRLRQLLESAPPILVIEPEIDPASVQALAAKLLES